MKPRGFLFWVLALIAFGTIAAGLTQLFAPLFVLCIIDGPLTSEAAYFFSIVGMFMAVIGGMLTHALFDTQHHRIVIVWCAVQKLSAAALVGYAVTRHLFGALAWPVAIFDLISGILLLVYFTRIRPSFDRGTLQ